MASFDYRLNLLYAIKECSSCGTLYTGDCGCSKGRLEDEILVPTLEEVFQDFQDTSESSDDDTNFVNENQEPFVVKQDPGVNSSRSPPQINHHCCYECGDSLDGIFCQRCTCKSCEKGAHIGYNCPPKTPIISKPEPWNQTIDEPPQALPSFDPTCYSEKENSLPYVSKPNFVDDSPNVFNPPPQPPMYSCEFCGNDARYGHYCTPQVLFIYPEPCYNQDFNFPQDFHDFQQQYLCCENCGGPHETYQCQPMNEDYYHEQNSCYDPNSFGFDQFQPPQYTVNHPIFNAQNDLLNSQNKLMEQMTSLCDMVSQYMQKKEEEKRIEEEQAAKARYWKIPVCYDDDDDDTIAITPVLPIEEPDNSLKSECDVPVFDDSTTFSNPLFDVNDDFSSSDDELFSDEDVPNKIYSNPLFDEEIISVKIDASIISMINSLVEQFSGELAHNDLIPPGINEADFELEEDIRFIERLLYDNSYPRPPEAFQANFDEIDIFSGPDESIPPGIESDDFDSEDDDNSASLPEFESFNVDYPDSGDSTIDVVEDIPVDMPNILPIHPSLHMDFDFIPSHNDLGSDLDDSSPSRDRNKIYDPEICIEVEYTRILATLSPVINTLLQFSSENEDKVFNHGVLAYKEKSPPSSSHRGLKAFQLSPESPMLIHHDNTPNLGDVPDFEASRARSFVLRSLELQILSFIWESDILILSTNVYL
ncbi:hypothetical protein Tco_1146701 [Tanacetum coccineum]